MRKYIPAIASFCVGNGVAGVLAWLGQTTPALIISIAFTIVGTVLFVYYWLKGRGKEQEDREANTNKEGTKIPTLKMGSKREQAQGIHNKILELDSLLKKTASGLSKDEDWLQNIEIKGILDKLQRAGNR